MAVPLHDMIDPRLVDFDTWAARITEVLFKTSSPPSPPEEKDWKTWATFLMGNGAFQQWDVPHPERFDDWREWGTWLKGIFP